MPKFSPEILIAIKAAIKASVEIKKIYSKDFLLQFRDGNPVSEADTVSNKIIKKFLSKTEIDIFSEEDLDNFSRLSKRKIWIIDPLDGTLDFINRTGEFSIIIGLVENKISVGGVIYKPIGDTLYVAEKNKGAYRCKDKIWDKISVSSISELVEARVVMSRHHLSTEDKEFLSHLKINNYIQCGSCGLKAASIAEGKAELYFTSTNKIKQWDTCAASCLIAEAGGEITDMFGQSLVYNIKKNNHDNGILVSNGIIYQEVINKLKILQK